MDVHRNAMSALSCMVMAVAISGSLAGFPGYQFYTQPIAAPYIALPVSPQRQLLFAPAHLPQHYYSPPGNTYSGFSYQTDYPDGGSSQVVFVTGPQSRQLMQQSIESFRRFNPDQAKLGVLTAKSTPKFNILTVAPTHETNSTATTDNIDVKAASDTNSTPVPLPNSVPLSLPNSVFSGTPQASVYRVQVFPSHVPQFPQLIRAPIPYPSIFASVYNPALQVNTNGNINAQQHENVDEAQESMISEVGTIPLIASNEIDSSTTTKSVTVGILTVETASTTETSTTAALNPSSEQVTEIAQKSPSTEPVTTYTPESSNIEPAVTTSPEDSLHAETGTTNAQEPSIISASADIGNRIQAETSTQAGAEEAITSENSSSTEFSEAVTPTTAEQETTTQTVTTELSANAGTEEQTTAEQTTKA